MPNLVLEYSNSVDERVNVQGLLEDLHKVALDSGLFELASVKSRALRCHNWLVGEEGDSVDFIHINFDLLTGRSQNKTRIIKSADGGTTRTSEPRTQFDGECSRYGY